MSPASGRLVGLDGFTFTIQVLLIGDPLHGAVLGVRLGHRLLGLLAGRVSRHATKKALIGVPLSEVIRVLMRECAPPKDCGPPAYILKHSAARRSSRSSSKLPPACLMLRTK